LTTTTAQVLLRGTEIRDRVAEIGAEISAAHPDGVVLVAVLKGSVPFLADIVRAITAPVEVDFMAVSTYGGSGGRVRIVKDLDTDIGGRNVVLVEDVVDTGLSLTYLVSALARRHPKAVEICALLDKDARRIVPVDVRWTGFHVDADFVVGYGLDYEGRYRNLDFVAAADLAALRSDPDAYVPDLYGR
jgi:hypoxanthine phosphoribosyltransferase